MPVKFYPDQLRFARDIREKPILRKYAVMHMHNSVQLECGPMPNVMAALPNTDGALCSTPQSLADAHY